MLLTWFLGALALLALGVTIKVWSNALNTQDFIVAQVRTPEDKERVRTQATRNQLAFTFLATVVTFIIIGAFVWLAFLVPNLDERQQEARKALYLAGYEQGWENQCEWVFFTMLDTPNGVLFNNNIPYDNAWCQSLQLAPVDFPATFGPDAYDQGQRAAGSAVETVIARVETLCIGDECADVESAWYDLLDSVADDWMRDPY